MRQLSGWNLLIEKRLHILGNSMDALQIVQLSSNLPCAWLLVRRPNPTQAPNKVGPFIPGLKRLILTQIFGKVLGGRLDKAEILPVSAMRVGLSDPFAKSVCKMWVRIRPSDRGMKHAAFL